MLRTRKHLKFGTLSNYQLMMALIDYCQSHTIEQILELPDVKERIDLFLSHQEEIERTD